MIAAERESSDDNNRRAFSQRVTAPDTLDVRTALRHDRCGVTTDHREVS
jgi:hypothetical protein